MAGRLMTKRKRKQAPMVAVTWVDASMSTDPHWQDGQQPERPKGRAAHVCVTVGFLAHIDDEWVQLVATLADGHHAHVTEIPRGMTRSIVVLQAGGDLDSA